MNNIITIEKIMQHKPDLRRFSCDRVRELIGAGKTPLEILDLDIPAPDRIWVLTQPGILPDRILHEFACQCAESVLHKWEEFYPDNLCPRRAIEAKRKWLNTKMTVWDLDAAREAALHSHSEYFDVHAVARSAERAAGRTAFDVAGASVWAYVADQDNFAKQVRFMGNLIVKREIL